VNIRWSRGAADDVKSIVSYIRRDKPGAARRIGQTIYERTRALSKQPFRGRRGKIQGTRELVLPPLPFIVIYRVDQIRNVIEVLNVVHGAQDWPPSD
jgi:toxin ParE1/3/4